MNKGVGTWGLFWNWEDRNPYTFSFFTALVFMVFTIFYTPYLRVNKESADFMDSIQVVNIQQVKMRKRIVKKQITRTTADSKNVEPQVERAVGISDDASAVDIAFVPNIIPPNPVGKLKKLYPPRARTMEVEALLNIELWIDKRGVVKNIKILGIRLTKTLPPDLHSEITNAFKRDAVKILLGAQFTPPIINGKKVPIKMEIPLRFRLD